MIGYTFLVTISKGLSLEFITKKLILYINNLECGMTKGISEPADETKTERSNRLNGTTSGINGLYRWSSKRVVQFSADKCRP